MPLSIESMSFEYISAPNQRCKRFGHRYETNSYSQRGKEPDKKRRKVLGLGDSVINGGVLVDQKDVATSIISDETDVQMLNISAGSWGPDNCAAYLKEYGLFDAEAIWLLVSSHDAFDVMDFQPVVGQSVSYPDKQYWCAWAELIDRYVWPRVEKRLGLGKQSVDPDQKVLNGIGIKKNGKEFNPGFDQIYEIAQNAGIPLYVCLHADKEELQDGQYNEQGELIIEWAKDKDLVFVKELEEGAEDSMYFDGIHFNAEGQRFEADLIKKYINL